MNMARVVELWGPLTGRREGARTRRLGKERGMKGEMHTQPLRSWNRARHNQSSAQDHPADKARPSAARKDPPVPMVAGNQMQMEWEQSRITQAKDDGEPQRMGYYEDYDRRGPPNRTTCGKQCPIRLPKRLQTGETDVPEKVAPRQ